MKKALDVTGRIELSRTEVTQAVFEFLKTKGYKSSKAVYLPSDDKFEGVVVEIKGSIAFDEVPKFGKEIKTKKQRSGYVRKNIGVNGTLRELLNDAFKKRQPTTSLTTEVNFQDLLKDVVYLYPGMNKKKLGIYLYDKRQLPNINYHAEAGKIIIRGIINH